MKISVRTSQHRIKLEQLKSDILNKEKTHSYENKLIGRGSEISIR